MTITDWLAIASLIIAIISIIYSFFTNRDKFIISASERKNILDWFEKTNYIIKQIIDCINNRNQDELNVLLPKLSSLIDVGRFYFPNIDKGNGYGKEKQVAFRGYRDITLDFLVYIYDIANRNNADEYPKHLIVLQREFTSSVFTALNPKHYTKSLSRNSHIKIKNDITINDFLASKNPSKFIFYC